MGYSHDELRQFAKDILDEKVLTNNDIFIAVKGDKELYLHLLKELFTAESLRDRVQDLADYLYGGGDMDKILYFAYLTDKTDDNSPFKKAFAVFGPDFDLLCKLMEKEFCGKDLH